MNKIYKIEKLRDIRSKISGNIGFVPTMGALHEGHLKLIREAKKICDNVIVSIFVNPTQFGPNEDFDRYPRQEEKDAMLCEEAGADIVFFPSVEEIYPEKPFVSLSVDKYTDILCGAKRPGHFNGVVQIVGILFNIVQPHKAFFGEKDFQQLFIIKKYAKTYHFPVEIISVPTVREKDGLAMSSRNAYLNSDERKLAPIIFETLKKIKSRAEEAFIENMAITTEFMEKEAISYITKKVPEIKIDYIEIRNEETLEKDEFLNKKSRIFAAVFLGKTRLIDNMRLS